MVPLYTTNIILQVILTTQRLPEFVRPSTESIFKQMMPLYTTNIILRVILTTQRLPEFQMSEYAGT